MGKKPKTIAQRSKHYFKRCQKRGIRLKVMHPHHQITQKKIYIF